MVILLKQTLKMRKLHLYSLEMSVEYKDDSLKLSYSKQGANGNNHIRIQHVGDDSPKEVQFIFVVD
jgi:hypothetical protein